MKRFKLYLVIASLTICTSLLGADQKTSYEEYEFRLKKIEEYRNIDDRKFDNKSKELDLKLEEYKQQKTIFDWIAISVGGLTLLSLYGLWLKARTIADKKIEEKLESILNDRKNHLIKIIDAHDNETQLKQNNIILIIASDKAKTDFLMNFFQKLGFSKIKLRKISTYETINEQEKYDILFLFREEDNAPLDDDISQEYIDSSRKDSVVFNFGKTINLQNGKKRFSSAIFWSQLYGNMISALKYQELID